MENQTEYQKEMSSLIEDIQGRVALKRLEDDPAQVLIGNFRTVEMLLDFYCGGQPDWSNKIMLQVDPEDEDSVVRVLRSPDLEYKEIIIL
jgi:hypothetical protein